MADPEVSVHLRREPATGYGQLRLIDFCITQLKAQGPSRTCNESKKEEDKNVHRLWIVTSGDETLHCQPLFFC